MSLKVRRAIKDSAAALADWDCATRGADQRRRGGPQGCDGDVATPRLAQPSGCELPDPWRRWGIGLTMPLKAAGRDEPSGWIGVDVDSITA